MINNFFKKFCLVNTRSSFPKMKKLIILITVTVLLVSCNSGTSTKSDQEKQIVTVSILPLKTFAEKISGNDFNIQVLVPHGASPETYSPLPSQLKQFTKSKAWFRLGYIEFELTLGDRIEQLNKNIEVVNLSEGLDLIAGKEVHHGDHVHLEGVDPHIWMSPKLVKSMATRMLEVLSELNPAKQAEYTENYQSFMNEIDQLDATIRDALKDYQGKAFVMFHPSLSYFARDYGLMQYSLESDGKEPTTQHMIKMVEMARKENIKAIYIQSEFDIDHAKVFAEEIKGKVVEVWPLNPEWEENLLKITHLFIENF